MNLIVFSFVVCVTITTTNSLTPSILPELRILGGKKVTIKDVPYLVKVLRGNKSWCSGSIISNTVILTAGHCVDKVTANTLSILAGATVLTGNREGIIHKVSKVHLHENFDKPTLDYDVGLLELATPLGFSEKIQPIRLPNDKEYLKPTQIVTIAGWGDPVDNKQKDYDLKEITIPVIKQKLCMKMYSNYKVKVTPRMFCAGNVEGGEDHCRGDSGGPVVKNGKVHGIVSWSHHVKCAQPFHPGVNTRVSVVRKWIRSKVGI